MKLSRTHIAAGGTTVALGALAAVAIGAGANQPAKTVTAPAKAPAAEVRTVVIHKTIRVVRREKPKKPKVVVPAQAPAAAATAPVVAQPRIVPVAQRQAAPAPKPAQKPVKTKTSGGYSGDDHEQDDHGEGGDGDD